MASIHYATTATPRFDLTQPDALGRIVRLAEFDKATIVSIHDDEQVVELFRGPSIDDAFQAFGAALKEVV